MKSFTFFKFLSKGDKTLFDVPVEIQLAFLMKLGDPRNDIERSYFQYLSQQMFVAVWKRYMLNFSSILLIPIIMPALLMKGLFVKRADDIDAIGEFKGVEDIVPTCLNENYNINNEAWREGFSLRFSDLSFIWSMIWSHQPYFVLKGLLKVAQYSHSVKLHKPKAFIVHNEYSFTSSLLTAFCERNNVKHINIMHGEKLLYIRDSFFRYHECYVWDTHYSDLFVMMKAESTQFRVAIPPSIKIDTQKFQNSKIYADYKYYLAIINENQMRQLVKVLKHLEDKGFKVKYRPHPRYTDNNILEKYLDKESIENPFIVSIQESIANCKYAIGSYTTVLNQAYYSGKGVVLDDLIYNNQYSKLNEMDYILAKKSDLTLSGICL